MELVGIPDPETFVQLPWDKRVGRVKKSIRILRSILKSYIERIIKIDRKSVV